MHMVDPFSLEGKRILVTGASSGIGRQIAITCALVGGHVVVSGRDRDRLHGAFSELVGEHHCAMLCDLNEDADVRSLAERVGKLDGVVHSAGISMLAPVRMASRKHIEDQMRVNAVAPMLLTQQLLQRNSINPEGSVVFISSISAHIGVPGVAAYGGSKGALECMARVLALEVAKKKIRVNCLAPGLVETPMLEAARATTGGLEDTLARYPLGVGRPDDVAHAVVFFLSRASRWITGTTLILDGGHTVS